MNRVTLHTAVHAVCVLTATLLLTSCDSSTSPERKITIEPGEARPFEMVVVRGLPGSYQKSSPFEVTVGNQPSVLLYDATEDLYRLVVPALPAGKADLVIPAAAGSSKSLRASFQVLPAQLVGGSSEAALAEMDELLDSVQVQSALALRFVTPATDTALVTRLDAVVELAEVVQNLVQPLTGQNREAAAAFYSANAPMLRDMADFLSVLVSRLGDQPPVLGSRTILAQLQGPVSATTLLQRCAQHVSDLERLDNLQEWMFWIAGGLTVLTAATAPLAVPAVAAIAAQTLAMMDAIVLLVSAMPGLLDPNGLRLQSSETQVRDDGGTALMSAWVQRQASGDVLLNAVSLGLSLKAVKESFQSILEMREALSRKTAIWEALRSVGLDKALETILNQLNRGIDDAVRAASNHVYGEVQVTFDGISLTANSQPSRWRFTGGAASAQRAFETLGKNSQAVESVTLAASMGSGDECRAATAASSPPSGTNGFEIVMKGSVRLDDAAPVSLSAGGSNVARLTAVNEGGEQASPITYRLATPTGGWTPPAWLSVTTPSGPGSLAAQASGFVSLTVRASADAPEQSVVIPVQALVNGKVTSTASVVVNVSPQLSDLVVNRDHSTIRLWDHGVQDGDIITVTLNGTPLASGHSLTNAGTTFPVTYRRGRNVLIIRAHNEGSLSPNTAAIAFANVVKGVTTQMYGLPTGGTTQLTITYDPAAQPSSVRFDSALPVPRFSRCGPERGRDCRP